jgi:hypothetical protein
MSEQNPSSAVWPPPVDEGGDCPTGEHDASFIVPDDQQLESETSERRVSRSARSGQRRGRDEQDRALSGSGQTFAIVSAGLGMLGAVLSVLTAVIPIAAAMLVMGLVIGVGGGVLLAPTVRQGATWLSRYLR